MTQLPRLTTIALAAGFAAAIAAFAAPAAPAAAPPTAPKATSTCWLDVVNDWLDNNRVNGVYAPPCYRHAIQQLSSRPDIAGYSSAIDDIHRALLVAIRHDNGKGGPPASGLGGKNPKGGGGANGGSGPGGGSSSGSPTTSNPHGGLTGLVSPSSATSIPLPLIVLGALAILLALAALGAWAARRFQTRRPAPAPAVSRRR
jgi:hypothetical protein